MRIALALAATLFAAPALADPLDPVDLRVMVRTEAVQRGLAPEIADAVATVESGYRPGAIGDVGEIGLMQVLPSTARMLGFAGTNLELADPVTNIRYGVDYLAGAWRLANGDVCTTVMKYRAGHGETRFSHKSVAYCARVRSILTAQGYPVRGELPKATFGDPGARASRAEQVPARSARSADSIGRGISAASRPSRRGSRPRISRSCADARLVFGQRGLRLPDIGQRRDFDAGILDGAANRAAHHDGGRLVAVDAERIEFYPDDLARGGGDLAMFDHAPDAFRDLFRIGDDRKRKFAAHELSVIGVLTVREGLGDEGKPELVRRAPHQRARKTEIDEVRIGTP